MPTRVAFLVGVLGSYALIACSNEPASGPADTGVGDGATADSGDRDLGTPIDSGMDGALADASGGSDATVEDLGPVSTRLGTAERPTEMIIPDSPAPGAPLLVLLHGYTGDSEGINWYFNMIEHARTRGVYLIIPDGTLDGEGLRYWNATSFCCGFEPRDADDETYLRNLVHEAIERFPIDPARVYFAGHSNGSFMSLRMACRMSDEVAAIAGFAGSDAPTAMPCVPTAPVSILHIHDTPDEDVPYAGRGDDFHPGAEELVDRWAAFNGCSPGRVSMGANIDLTPDTEGAETERYHYNGCPEGVDVVLYKMIGGSHSATFQDNAWGDVLDWLTAHHR